MFPSLQRVPFKLLHYCLIFKVQPLSRSVCFALSEAACILYQPLHDLSTPFFELFYNFLKFSLCNLTNADFNGKTEAFIPKTTLNAICFCGFYPAPASALQMFFRYFSGETPNSARNFLEKYSGAWKPTAKEISLTEQFVSRRSCAAWKHLVRFR